MRKAKYIGIGAVLILAVLAFIWPHPIFKPNWMPRFEAALEADDCDTALRYLDLAGQDDVPGWRTALTILETRNACGFQDNERYSPSHRFYKTPEERVDYIRSLEIDRERPFYSRIWNRSLMGAALRVVRVASWPEVRSSWPLLWGSINTLPSCSLLLSPTLGGFETYRYMSMAMRSSKLSQEAFEKIQAKRNADFGFCARRAAALAHRMEAFDTHDALSKYVFEIWLLASYLGLGHPDMEYEAVQYVNRAKQLLAGDRHEPEPGGLGLIFGHHERGNSFCDRRPPQHPTLNLNCARWYLNRSTDMTGANANASAYFYLLRAERMGIDFRALHETVTGKLSGACMEKMRQFERGNAAGSSGDGFGNNLYEVISSPPCVPEQEPTESDDGTGSLPTPDVGEIEDGLPVFMGHAVMPGAQAEGKWARWIESMHGFLNEPR